MIPDHEHGRHTMDSTDDTTYTRWLKQASFTDVTSEVNDKFRHAKRRDNAKRKDHRTTGRTFERVAVPYTRQPKHRLTTTQED